MQNLSVNFYQRIMLWQLVGGHQVTNLKDAAIYLRLIEKLRLTDAEMLASQFVNENGRFSWRLPEAGYGDKEIELEHEEAKSLGTAIEAATPIRVNDAEWMLKVVEQLTAGQPQAAQAA